MKEINFNKLQPILILLLIVLLFVVLIDLGNTINLITNEPVIIMVDDKPLLEQHYLAKLIITERYALVTQLITIITIVSYIGYYSIKQITNSKPN